MFVYCPTCHNNYDDECQSEDCAGVGVKAGVRNSTPTAHEMIKFYTAGEDHVRNTRAANGRPMNVSNSAPRHPSSVPLTVARSSDA